MHLVILCRLHEMQLENNSIIYIDESMDCAHRYTERLSYSE